MAFPDSKFPDRLYLQSGNIIVKSINFIHKEGCPHNFNCEVEFAPTSDQLSYYSNNRDFTGKNIVPLPWESGRVKIWGHRGGRPVLLSSGKNSGIGQQNSIHMAGPDYIPGKIYLTTELKCLCSTKAKIQTAAWSNKPEKLFPEIMDHLDSAVMSAWKKRQIITMGQIAASVTTDLLKKNILELTFNGDDAPFFKQQMIHTIANLLLKIAYMDTQQPEDVITSLIQTQRYKPSLPDPKHFISTPFYYRHPLVRKIGYVPGKCKLKIAPGLDWGQLTSIRVFVDANNSQTLHNTGIKPWHTIVFSQGRQQHTIEEPCYGHFWAEADCRDYSTPLRLPDPEIINDLVIIDAPPQIEDKLIIKLDRDLPKSLFPLKITFLSSARHIEPKDGVLHFTTQNNSQQIYQGVRWDEEDDNSKFVTTSISYNIDEKNKISGNISLKLRWGFDNKLKIESFPALTVSANNNRDKLTSSITIAQGDTGPEYLIGEQKLDPGKTITQYINGSGGKCWIQTNYYKKNSDDLLLKTSWELITGNHVKIDWPEFIKIRISAAPDVPEGNEVWIAPGTGTIEQAQKIPLQPFAIKVLLLSHLYSQNTPSFRIALALDEESSPPSQEERWLVLERKKVLVNSHFLAKLKDKL